jgi:GR25 family glycosyltransferase involved in LPS biosynthesis
MILFFILLLLVVYILISKSNKSKYGYKCFLLTIKDQKKRQERFKNAHNPDIPFEIIYGPDTRTPKQAQKYENIIEDEYYEKALEMYEDPTIKRPDITYFNLGAIGCFMGHMEFYKRCYKQGIKYAVIFEDNVIIKSNQLYDEIQHVIDTKKDDFEMCFFHCLSRLVEKEEDDLEKVKWISSTKCYLINVENMKNYTKYFLPMDNHVDMKHEDLISNGARVYYKDLRHCIKIDRSHRSTIGHSEHSRKNFFSRHNENANPGDLKKGY